MTLLAGWPDDLVEQAVKRNLVLIVGSGISATSELAGKRPPTWKKLLRELVEKLDIKDRKDEIENLIVKERLLDAAELLRQEARRAGRDQDFLSHVRQAVDGKSPDNYPGSAWHEALLRLEPTIIVTTNYDKIIERASAGGYAAHFYNSGRVA